ncbi:MAG TPA: metallophosphoesterase family protein, partial [Armatimonadota bacterium]|nr:metallophosphoesterase family protein [Armatimonadota bacterium]
MAKQQWGRLAILGDAHVTDFEDALWQQAIDNVNATQADRVFLLGDMTGGPWMGREAGLRHADQVLQGLDAPWQSIIGNHDLENELPSDAQAVQRMLTFFRRDTPWFHTDCGAVSVIGLSNTQFRE